MIKIKFFLSYKSKNPQVPSSASPYPLPPHLRNGPGRPTAACGVCTGNKQRVMVRKSQPTIKVQSASPGFAHPACPTGLDCRFLWRKVLRAERKCIRIWGLKASGHKLRALAIISHCAKSFPFTFWFQILNCVSNFMSTVVALTNLPTLPFSADRKLQYYNTASKDSMVIYH